MSDDGSTEATAPQAMFSLRGRVALVTGASRGLGFEMALALAQAEAQVFINGSDAGRAEAAAQRIRESSFQAQALPFDIGDEAAARAGIDAIAERAGRLDILINNVGIRMRAPLDNIAGDDLRLMLNVDLVAPFVLSKAAAKVMSQGGYGRIIMISSVQGMLGRRGDAAYITAKGGLIALTRALAAEFGSEGITCNAIAPGSFATETNAQALATAEAQTLVRQRTFLRRAGAPAEIGGAAVFLASAAAGYVTGVVLPIDGGWSAAF